MWIESPTNPSLEIADIAAISQAASRSGAAVAVDNTFATPLRQKPLEQGADFVVHSASKLLSGHSDVILGAVVTNSDRAYAAIEKRRSVLGAIPGAMETWLAARGMRTLHVRLDRAEANAKELHKRLSASSRIVYSRYPGIRHDHRVRGRRRRAGRTEDDRAERHHHVRHEPRRRRVDLGAPSTAPGEPESVPEGLIRFSVGIEDVEDLWIDIQNVLAAFA